MLSEKKIKKNRFSFLNHFKKNRIDEIKEAESVENSTKENIDTELENIENNDIASINLIDNDFNSMEENKEELLYDKKVKKYFKKPAFRGDILILVAAVLVMLAALSVYYFTGKNENLFPFFTKKNIDKEYNLSKSLYPERNFRDVLYQKAVSLYESGFLPAAYDQFDKVVSSSTDKELVASSLIYMGIIKDEEGDFVKAEELFFRASKYGKNNYLVYKNLAVTYKHQGNIKDALKYIDKALKLNKKDPENYIIKGNIFFTVKDYLSAVNTYLDGLKYSPKDPVILYNLGLNFEKTGDTISAIKYYKKALRHGTNRVVVSSALNIAAIYYRAGDLEHSAEYYKRVIDLDEKNYLAHYNLGIIFLKQDKLDTALKYFEKASKLNPSFVEGYETMGDIFVQQNNSRKGVIAYQEALKTDPNNPRIYASLGDVYFRLKDFDNALNTFQRVVELSPMGEEAKIAYVKMGNIYSELQEYVKAEKSYREAIALDPKDDDLYYNLGVILYKNALYSDAISAWKKCLSINPKNRDAKIQIARYYVKQGYLDDALQEYKEITSEFPDYDKGYFYLGDLYYQKSDYARSREAYEKALSISRDKKIITASYINLGNIYSEIGDLDKAESSYKKSVILSPNNIEALYNLGILYYKLKNFSEAKKLFIQIKYLNGPKKIHAMAYIALGNIYYQTGKYKKAIREYNNAINEDPSSTEAHINLKNAIKEYEERM